MENLQFARDEIIYKVRLFRRVFKGREDIVPKFWRSKDGRRSGYTPLCRNEWKRGICRKPCRTCDNSVYIALSNDLVLEHLRGKLILGTYPLLSNNTCNFIAADFDNHYGQGDALLGDIESLYHVYEVQDIPCYALRSKSGHGYHLYTFFDRPVPAWKARVVVFALLEEAQIGYGGDESHGFDRLFPSQDKLSGRGFGNLIALPFQGNAAREGQHTLFLDPDSGFLNPYADQWAILNSIRKVRETQLDEIIKKWGLGSQPSEKSQIDPFSERAESALQILRRSCKFIRFCSDFPEKVSEPLWYAMISNIVSVRPGGYSIVHRLSKGYPGYDHSETDRKIHHALDASGPHTCEYIMKNGFNCDANCEVRAPVVLLSRLENHNGG